MASAMNKKVQAVRDCGTLLISNQTIYSRQLQFEIENEEVDKLYHIDMIFFSSCFMMKFPDAHFLLKITPNLKRLQLYRTNLARIYSEDLRGFEKLETLFLDHNEIEELPSDLFIYTPNLGRISFTSNKIKVIGENILEPLKNLKSFDLRDNPGINTCYDNMSPGIHVCSILAQFKEAIERCKPAQNVWNTVDELDNLKTKFEAQEKEISDLKKLCLDQGAKIEEQKKAINDINKLCVDQGAKIEGLEKKLEEAKQDGAFHKFDFTIKINGKTFKVQKEILAANSPVLADLIRDNEDADELELKDISEEVFEEILNFMVKKTQPKPTANFMEIYAASGALKMKELMDLCAQTLMGKVTKENTVKILGLCEKYPNIELGKKAFDEMKKIYEEP